MTQNKMTAPVLAHRNGQKNEPTQKLNFIVPYLRHGVKTACVTLCLYIAAGLAGLNHPALLLGVLVLNALLGVWFALVEEVAECAAS